MISGTLSLNMTWVMHHPAGIYLLKVNDKNTRTRCEICSKLHQNDANSDALVSLLLTLNIFHTLF